MPVFYKGRRLKAPYRADFVCHEEIIVEVKALTKTGQIEWAQVLNYLKASSNERGLLINLGLGVWSTGVSFGPTRVLKEPEQNLRNRCNLRIFIFPLLAICGCCSFFVVYCEIRKLLADR